MGDGKGREGRTVAFVVRFSSVVREEFHPVILG